MRRDVKDPALTAKEKTRLRRKMDREWMPALTSSEHKCMVFLFNMVTDWGKSRDRVMQEQFVSGTKSIAGTGLSLRTVIRALASLAEKGAVTRLRTPRGHVYAINFDWSPVVDMKPRKALAKPVSTPVEASAICQAATLRYASTANAHLREIPVQEIPNNRSPSDYASVFLTRDRFGKEKVSPYVDPLDITNLRATWTAAVAEAFPDLTPPTWTKREDAQACLFVRVSDKAKRLNALDVLAWAARSWRTIIAARFAWMTTNAPPIFPDIGFMLRWKTHFYDAWNDRERLRSEITMDGKDRRVRQSMHRGMSFEEAQKTAEEGDALARARIAVAEKARVLDEMLRRSEARGKLTLEQRLARVTNLDTPRMQPPRYGPVRPGREGMTTAFDTATPGEFEGGFCTQVQMREAP